MKQIVEIGGNRNGHPVDIPVEVTPDGEHLTFTIPTVPPRQSACTFSISIDELYETLGVLAPRGAPVAGVAALFEQTERALPVDPPGAAADAK